MTDLERLIEVSHGDGPRPEFVAELRQRVLDEAGEQPSGTNGAVLIDLNGGPSDALDPENRMWGTTRLVLAAAAALLLIGISAVLISQNNRGTEIIEPTETTEPNELEPVPTSIQRPPATFNPDSERVIDESVTLEPGSYRFDTVGTPLSFSTDSDLTPDVVLNMNGRFVMVQPGSVGPDDRDISFGRLTVLADPENPVVDTFDPATGWPANDALAWANSLSDPFVVTKAEESTLGGRSAVLIEVHVAEDACSSFGDFCVLLGANLTANSVPEQTCECLHLQMLKEGSRYRIWIVDQGNEPPLLVKVGVASEADIEWFEDAEDLLDTLAFGTVEPNPILASAPGPVALPFLGGVEVELPDDAYAVRASGSADEFGRIAMDNWPGSTDLLTNPQDLNGRPLETAADLAAALRSRNIAVEVQGSTTVAGLPATILVFEDPGRREALAVGVDGTSTWRAPRRAQLWVVEHPDRGLLVITAEAFENADIVLPLAVTQTEGVLESLAFIDLE